MYTNKRIIMLFKEKSVLLFMFIKLEPKLKKMVQLELDDKHLSIGE